MRGDGHRPERAGAVARVGAGPWDGEAASWPRARLDSAGEVPGGWFPRTRSWLALGSPLELLGPLSVLRVNFAFGALAFTLLGCLGATTWGDVTAAVAVGACTFAIWVLLLGLDGIGPNPCRLLSAYWTTAVAVLVVVDRSGRTAAVLGFLLVPSAVFVSLFFGLRIVLWQLGLASIALWLALSTGHGSALGLLLALVSVAAMATAPVAVLVVSRASRRSGLVDPETGLPNGLGLSSAGTGSSGHVAVAVVSLGGVGECREALGYAAAAELLRRAVEHLGRVVPVGARIGRVGGDEVIVVLDRPTAPTPGSGESLPYPDGEALARALVAAIGTGRYLVGDLEVSMRAHVGLAESPKDGRRLEDLIRRSSLSAAPRRPARCGHLRLGRRPGRRDTRGPDAAGLVAGGAVRDRTLARLPTPVRLLLACAGVGRGAAPLGSPAARTDPSRPLRHPGRAHGADRPPDPLGGDRGARRPGALARTGPRPPGVGQRLGQEPGGPGTAALGDRGTGRAGACRQPA